jgi:hypothetical protein
MVSVTQTATSHQLSAADEAAIYELLRSAPRKPADIAATLRIEQMYIEQHLSFEAVTGVIAQHDGAYTTWRSDIA